MISRMKHNYGLKKFLHVSQKANALRKSDGIICISNYSKNLMFKLYPFTKSKPVTVIHNGISSSFINEHKKKNSITRDINDYVLYVGDRKAKYKNFDFACKVVEKANRKLVIVGGGDLTNDEKYMLKNIRYQHFHLFQKKELIKIYKNAFCLLYPSESEGFGIPVSKLQILRCPVISINKTSIPEVSNGHAILIDSLNISEFIDAFKKIKNENFRSELCNNGYNNAKNYTWEKSFEKTLEFYNRVYNQSN